MIRIQEPNHNYLVRITVIFLSTLYAFNTIHSCFNYHYIMILGRGVYKGDKIHGKASSNHFDSLSSRPRRFKPKPRFQDGIDLPKELRQQRSTTSGEYSFDLELGASASKVNQRQKEKESLKPTNSCLQKIPKGF